MTEPHLDCAEVHSVPQVTGGESRSELVEPKVVFIKLGTLGDGLQIIEKIHLHIASRGRNVLPQLEMEKAFLR